MPVICGHCKKPIYSVPKVKDGGAFHQDCPSTFQHDFFPNPYVLDEAQIRDIVRDEIRKHILDSSCKPT